MKDIFKRIILVSLYVLVIGNKANKKHFEPQPHLVTTEDVNL